MLGYKAMAMAAEDPNLEVTWGHRTVWLTYQLIGQIGKDILARKNWAVRKKKPELPKKYGWVCPVCGRGNGPYASTCPCKPLPPIEITF